MTEESEPVWHVDKRISLGHIITTLTVAITAVAWMTRLESKTIINAADIKHNTDSISRVETSQEKNYEEIIRRLERIADKMDKK